jgi:metal-sulfur cluster biosynthetic enzyme
VWKQLRTCFDPEIPINVVDLGLVYEAVVKPHPEHDGKRLVEVQMTLTAPGAGWARSWSTTCAASSS